MPPGHVVHIERFPETLTRTLEQYNAALPSLDITLSAEQLARLVWAGA